MRRRTRVGRRTLPARRPPLTSSLRELKATIWDPQPGAPPRRENAPWSTPTRPLRRGRRSPSVAGSLLCGCSPPPGSRLRPALPWGLLLGARPPMRITSHPTTSGRGAWGLSLQGCSHLPAPPTPPAEPGSPGGSEPASWACPTSPAWARTPAWSPLPVPLPRPAQGFMHLQVGGPTHLSQGTCLLLRPLRGAAPLRMLREETGARRNTTGPAPPVARRAGTWRT